VRTEIQRNSERASRVISPIRLLGIVRPTIGTEHVVKPRRGLVGVGPLPGVPRIVRLCLALDEPQLIAPPRYFHAIGKVFWKVLPTLRAMYSVQIIDRLSRATLRSFFSKTAGLS
jgi:hypothetical protein